jgi:transcriptional regulator with XRE-family HTH domain
MAKREIETEPMGEDSVEANAPTVGDRLRAAREKTGITLEDIAAQTRIPQRHLESIETAEWDNLPAPTYTIGFAKSYAGAVGLDRNEIGDQLREEMGGHRFASSQSEPIEAGADDAQVARALHGRRGRRHHHRDDGSQPPLARAASGNRIKRARGGG